MEFGTSEATQKLLRDIDKVANTDISVLITGETGTGKEVVGRTIHKKAARRDGRFVAVNCAALPEQLIQSELFGHEKGAFTGAHEKTIGKIEQADGGVLFLDEIGDLPLNLQANLLRFLQDRIIVRVGGRKQINVDVRIIAATHVNIEQAIRNDQFREDLYHRLNVLHLHVSSLRKRLEDINVLAGYFVDEFVRKNNTLPKKFSDEALRVLRSHSWPGNVRELENRIKRAVIMSEGRLITPEDLGLERRTIRPCMKTLREARDETEKSVIQFTLRCTDRKVSEAASLLGVTRATLYRLIAKHEIESNIVKVKMNGGNGKGPQGKPQELPLRFN